MPRPRNVGPTEGELEILHALWKLGDGGIRDVHQALSAERDVAYTTVSTMLQVMLQKGLVEAVKDTRPQRFRPVHSIEQTRDQLLTSMAKLIFGGSISKMTMHLLSRQPATPKDLAEAKRLRRNMGK